MKALQEIYLQFQQYKIKKKITSIFPSCSHLI